MARKNRHRSGSGWDSVREDKIQRFGKLSPRERRARSEADPLNGVRFLDYDATYDNLFQPVSTRPTSRASVNEPMGSSPAPARVRPAAGTAFDQAKKTKKMGTAKRGLRGLQDPNKKKLESFKTTKRSPENAFVVAPALPAKRSPTARGAGDGDVAKPRRRDVRRGTLRPAASAAESKARSKALGDKLMRRAEAASPVRGESRRADREDMRDQAVAHCKERPPGVQDHSAAGRRKSRSFVPWCK